VSEDSRADSTVHKVNAMLMRLSLYWPVTAWIDRTGLNYQLNSNLVINLKIAKTL
jgi:hypothetical protein